MELPYVKRSPAFAGRAITRVCIWVALSALIAWGFAKAGHTLAGVCVAIAIVLVAVLRSRSDWSVRIVVTDEGVASLGRYGARKLVPWSQIYDCQVRNVRSDPAAGMAAVRSMNDTIDPWVICLKEVDGTEIPIWGTAQDNSARAPHLLEKTLGQADELRAEIRRRNPAANSSVLD